MHINIIHIIIAVSIGLIVSLARRKDGKISMKRALLFSIVFALVIVAIDWVRL